MYNLNETSFPYILYTKAVILALYVVSKFWYQ